MKGSIDKPSLVVDSSRVYSDVAPISMNMTSPVRDLVPTRDSLRYPSRTGRSCIGQAGRKVESKTETRELDGLPNLGFQTHTVVYIRIDDQTQVD